jgi:hypothetical protein
VLDLQPSFFILQGLIEKNKEIDMNDQNELFFDGGLTLRVNSDSEKTANRKMRTLAKKSRLPFSGRHIVISTLRAA